MINFPRLILGLISVYFLIERQYKYFSHSGFQSKVKYVSTTLIWSFFLVIAIFPTIAHDLSALLGFGQNFNTLIFTGFIIVFVIISKLLNIIERIERNIVTLTQELALKDKPVKPKTKKK